MQHKAVVVAHQAVSQHLRVKALKALLNNRQQRNAVLIVSEDALAPISARGHVVHGAGELDAQWA